MAREIRQTLHPTGDTADVSQNEPVTNGNTLQPAQSSGLIPQAHGGALRNFPPGVSGNPGGRPKRKHITEAIVRIGNLPPEQRRKLKPKDAWEEMAAAQIDRSAGGAVRRDRRGRLEPIDPDPYAYSVLADRLEGKVGATDPPEAEHLPTDQLRELLVIYIERLAKP